MEQVSRHSTETGTKRYCEACGDRVLMERTELARGMGTTLRSRPVRSPAGRGSTGIKKTVKAL